MDAISTRLGVYVDSVISHACFFFRKWDMTYLWLSNKQLVVGTQVHEHSNNIQI